MILNAFLSSHIGIFAVYFYNFGMEDFGVSSLVGMIDGVKVLAFAVSEGRVAVHCHAGLGRTGRSTSTGPTVHVSTVCVSLCISSVFAPVFPLRCPDSLLPHLHPAHQPE